MATCPIDDRLALEDLTIAFAHGIDSMTDSAGIALCFTEDCAFDLSGIGMATLTGRGSLREFYEGTFAANDHHAHLLSNFAVTAFGGDTASVRTYVTGMARGKDGSSITVHGRYYFDAVRTTEGWRFARYWMDFLIPPG